MAECLHVEVAYARPGGVFCIPLELAPGSTVADAIRQSGLLEQCPEIDLSVNRVGIFASLCELDHEVAAGDRIEIYRPLKIDPKEARRRRAASRSSRQ
ncbi:MAG: RnfH family protein [Gammaproteobacteria bacterium]|nr:RnfH family protein [Gammaproteobacteria bacterium]